MLSKNTDVRTERGKMQEIIMNIGYKIVENFERPPEELVEQFRNLPVPNIGDSMNRTAAISSVIQPMNNGKLLGTAYTVRVPAGDNLLFYYAIDRAKPGDVIVVDGGGFKERALCGEIMVTLAIKRKLAGFVVDGAIRDRAELSELEFPVFARSSNPNGPYKNGPGEVNVPVTIGGKVVYPGDILVGDRNGLVVVRPEDAKEVLANAHDIMIKEKEMMEQIEKYGHLDLDWMYKKLEKDHCTIIC